FFFFSSRRRHTRFSRDWSSDVCSSDLSRLLSQAPGTHTCTVATLPNLGMEQLFDVVVCIAVLHFAPGRTAFHAWADACWQRLLEIGRASCRERVWIAVVAGVLEVVVVE